MEPLTTELARQLVTSYLLDPGETILEVLEGTVAVEVTTSERGWLVRPLERGRHFVRGAGYALYDIGPSDDSGPASHGVALLPDDRSFHLNDAGEFRAFFAAVRPPLTPLELAGLLAFYQARAPGAESVVAGEEDLAWLFPSARLEDFAGLTVPRLEYGADGGLDGQFCTLYLAPNPADRLIAVNFNRWQVSTTADGELRWTVEPLARDLRSPRYAPNG